VRKNIGPRNQIVVCMELGFADIAKICRDNGRKLTAMQIQSIAETALMALGDALLEEFDGYVLGFTPEHMAVVLNTTNRAEVRISLSQHRERIEGIDPVFGKAVNHSFRILVSEPMSNIHQDICDDLYGEESPWHNCEPPHLGPDGGSLSN